MAVINEDVSTSLHPYCLELACIRGPPGREFSTAVDNIAPQDRSRGPAAASQSPSRAMAVRLVSK